MLTITNSQKTSFFFSKVQNFFKKRTFIFVLFLESQNSLENTKKTIFKYINSQKGLKKKIDK